MPIKVTFLTIIYLTVACIYNMLGVYVLSLNPRKLANRLFFILNMGLCFWALCFGIRNFNISEEMSHYITLVSVLGWGTVFSLIYYFIKTLRLGEKKEPVWFYIFVYGSAVVNTVLFFVLPITNGGTANIVYSSWGWTAVSTNNFKEIYYNIYYLVFSIATFVNLYYWYKETEDKSIRFRIKLLSASLIAVGILVIPTEVIISRMLQIQIVQLMVIWMIIPTMTMFYLIRKYRFLYPAIKLSSNQMLDEKMRRKLFGFIAQVYIFISYASFILYYINGGLHYYNAVYSFVIYALGVGHIIVNRLANKVETQYWYLTLAA